ncbi:formimidoylglutamase [Vibrio sp. 99-70-13A1]|uniref:formimidoylglutamase n=1 Tax=Vibrio sp. 99-70-13A1 TaxID=2607601 RepID=UPI001493873D|nr:formimidoylglutamase [Vibrio sp. 99-70-13A1]NOH97918.1 formimidoylglutamase [Vibrio sp. 99-70-13A1]
MTDSIHKHLAKIDLPSTNHSFIWQGRHDEEDGDKGTRLHHITKVTCVSQLTKNESCQTSEAVSIVGFASDAGVARNKGRIGAKQAPNLIRQALANMAWHQHSPIFDLGDIECEEDELESSQEQCANVIAHALEKTKVITLGGGHEVAWASFQGLAQFILNQQEPIDKHASLSIHSPLTQHSSQEMTQPKVGIINFDAHFDLRAFESDIAQVKPSSGTPFNQIQHFCQQHGWPFHYACLGVSRASNTAALFEKADDLGVWYVEDNELSHSNTTKHLAELERFIGECDIIYLTIDLDVFPAATAPGVSAPAARGVSYDSIAPLFTRILQEKSKLLIADIAEYNPNFDIDGQTARLAARLCWDIVNAMQNKQ